MQKEILGNGSVAESLPFHAFISPMLGLGKVGASPVL